MVETGLDLAAHELSAGEDAAGTEECFCECTLPPGEECYTCYDCTAVCDAEGGTECICATCYCDCAVAQNDDGDDGSGGGDDGGDDGANESV